MIEVREPVTHSFALRYLNIFSKAAPLGPAVILSISKVQRRPARGWPTRSIVLLGLM